MNGSQPADDKELHLPTGALPPRAYYAGSWDEAEARLDREESRHLVRVRRLAAGERVQLFDGRGVVREGVLLAADPSAARVRLEGAAIVQQPPRQLDMYVAWPEPSRRDELVEALAALGVSRLVPIWTQRTQRDRAGASSSRHERRSRLVREALKVSGYAVSLVVEDPIPLADALRAGTILLDTHGKLPLLGEAIRCDASPSCGLLVGPEGGFTAAERAAAGEAGLVFCSLGPGILRVERAAAAAAAIVLGALPPNEATAATGTS